MSKFRSPVAHLSAAFFAAVLCAGASAATDDLEGAIATVNLAVTKVGSGSGTVKANSGPIDCGGTCSGAYITGTTVTLTATPAYNHQFTGWLGACTGMSTCVVTMNSARAASATFAPLSVNLPRIDVDGTGTYDALADGLLIVRYLFGLTNNALISNAVGSPSPTRMTAAQISNYLTNIKPVLDVDGNGVADAYTDGMLILRYLFGLRDEALVAGGLGAGATRTTIVGIQTYLADLLLPNVLRGPYLLVATPTSVTVRWRTDVTTSGRVRYGTDPLNLSSTADSLAPTKDHEVVLNGLAPDTRYYYTVGQTAQILSASPNHKFVTPPPVASSKPTRIWVIGDAGSGTAQQTSVRDAYQSFNGARETDLILFLGDNAYNVGTEAEYQAFHFDIYPDALRSTVSWYTLGNHDAGTGPVGAHPYYSMFSFPTTGQAGGVASGSKAYNSFNYGNIHFINLDSQETNRATDGAMAQWLTSDLQNNTLPWVVAFFHHPPYDKGTHNSDTETQLIQMRTNMLPILEQYGVDLVLAGHSHVYERSYLIDGHYGLSTTFANAMKKDGGDGRPAGNGAYGKPNMTPTAHEGTVYVVAGSSGQPGGFQPGGFHPAMFISLNNAGSLVMDLKGNRLDVSYVRDTGAIDDTFSLIKGTVSGNLPPTVTITSPAGGATFSSPPTIALQASASDPGGGFINIVDYYNGATLIGSSGVPPYTVQWLNPPVGNHRITARATDNAIPVPLRSISPPVFINVTP